MREQGMGERETGRERIELGESFKLGSTAAISRL